MYRESKQDQGKREGIMEGQEADEKEMKMRRRLLGANEEERRGERWKRGQ